MQLQNVVLTLLISIMLSGCATCPDSISFYPRAHLYENSIEIDGFNFGAEWSIPLKKHNLCREIHIGYRYARRRFH